MRIAHDASGRTYGAPWVHRELQAEELPTSTTRRSRRTGSHASSM